MIRFLAIMICLSSPLWAGINVRTQAPPLRVDGMAEEAGVMIFVIDDDDFHSAGADSPSYIRLLLGQGARLCETLVDFDDPESGHIREPIYLPLKADRSEASWIMAAPPDTIEIARWIAGEDQIWLRVNSSSFEWFDTPFGPLPPNFRNTVSFALGVAGEVSNDFYVSEDESPEAFNANLPFSTRDAQDPTMPVSTLLCLNLSSGILQSNGPQDTTEQSFSPIAFGGSGGVETATSSDGIDIGFFLQVSFSNDTTLGYGAPVPATLSGGDQ